MALGPCGVREWIVCSGGGRAPRAMEPLESRCVADSGSLETGAGFDTTWLRVFLSAS